MQCLSFSGDAKIGLSMPGETKDARQFFSKRIVHDVQTPQENW